MFRRLTSAIFEDDNPRLHRVPFLLLWILSFGLAWYALYFYEILWYEPRLDSILSWLKFSSSWGEGIVIGLIFGLTLSFIQTWLIRQRYGYIPKFWRVTILIGAIITGLGYPRIGLRTGESFIGYNWMVGGSIAITSINSLINDFFIWFMVLSLFQTIALFRVNRKAWLFIVVGLLAAIVASVPLPQQCHIQGPRSYLCDLSRDFRERVRLSKCSVTSSAA